MGTYPLMCESCFYILTSTSEDDFHCLFKNVFVVVAVFFTFIGLFPCMYAYCRLGSRYLGYRQDDIY